MRITMVLVAVNVAAFGLQLLFPGFTELFALTPGVALSYPWQIVTYMFMHGGFYHIFINMFVLLIFGPMVEHALGEKRFIILYFLAGLGSAALHFVLTGLFSGTLPLSQTLLGASGAVFGVLAAYAFLFPKNIIVLFLFPMPAMVAVIVIVAMELVLGILNILPGIASFGHVGGVATALAIMLFWKLTGGKVPVEDRDLRNYEFIWE